MKMEAENRVEQLKKATDRIQREIEEVTEREHELRNAGSIKTTSHETVDSKVRRIPQALVSGKLKRTTSTPQLLETVSLVSSTVKNYSNSNNNNNNNNNNKMANGVISTNTNPRPLRFATAPSQKGLMHRFLASRGKIYKPTKSSSGAMTTATMITTTTTTTATAAATTNANNDFVTSSPPPTVSTIALSPLSMKTFNRNLEIHFEPDNDEPKKPPVRKGYVPVEEKIQKELHEMKERENELRLMRSQMLAKSQPNLLDIGTDNDSDIFDESGGSLRSGASSTNLTNEDEVERENRGKHKPNPRRRSTLIAQWESLIAAKKESTNENNNQDQMGQDQNY